MLPIPNIFNTAKISWYVIYLLILEFCSSFGKFLLLWYLWHNHFLDYLLNRFLFYLLNRLLFYLLNRLLFYLFNGFLNLLWLLLWLFTLVRRYLFVAFSHFYIIRHLFVFDDLFLFFLFHMVVVIIGLCLVVCCAYGCNLFYGYSGDCQCGDWSYGDHGTLGQQWWRNGRGRYTYTDINRWLHILSQIFIMKSLTLFAQEYSFNNNSAFYYSDMDIEVIQFGLHSI